MLVRVSDEENMEKIRVCSLDCTPECESASFIKMDIERSEFNAIKGARDIIMRNRPVLTISIYYSDEDMLRIIELIMSMCTNYSFYVRQHSFLPIETIFMRYQKKK